MKKMLIALPVIIAITGVALAFGAVPTDSSTPQGGPSGTASHVTVGGLPDSLTPSLFLVQPAVGGGYIRLRELATGRSADLDLPAGSIVESGPLPVSNLERWMPAERFQTIMSAGASLNFTYRREFLVTVAKWSTGPAGSAPVGVVMGDVSRESGWVAEGSYYDITASPKPGWRFLHWGVFTATESASRSRVSAILPSVRVQVNGPLYLLAGFGR